MSLMVTISDQPTLLQWAGERTTGIAAPWEWSSDSKAMGVVERETGRIVAVVVVNAFGPDSCEAHICSDGRRKWATYGVLRAIFHYIFLVLGVRRVVASAPTSNTQALKVRDQMGFSREGVLRLTPDGSEMASIGQMFNTECKYIADLMEVSNGKA